ncbi:hypothetical protein GCM10011490_08450 [Pseudoclavibacter endophyticus]|nr:DUF4245 family protein [Pseudoclavibacter endophyticus]GGA60586.1 hypothetical protein GCM10011490_08450 [Pseudoclavibacter endophyticus]
MAKQSQPPVVAELGRPETPEEAAARKAEASRLHRARQTFRNLLASLAVCALIVLVMVLIVPRDDSPVVRDIDYAAAAAEAASDVSAPLAAPELPSQWTSNEAELRTGADGVTEWYIGFILSDGDGNAAEFVGMSQGLDANPTWLADRVAKRAPTSTTVVGGLTWDEYDYTDLPPGESGNNAYTLVLERAESTYVVYGSHSADAVQTVAQAIADAM